ncbi:MAG: PmoA family protein, partial [Planctomycetaceae bacterium]|nr:PmoA family protein [Planctomycetaceae bacterium]
MKKTILLLSIVWGCLVFAEKFVCAQDVPTGTLRTYDGRDFYHHRFRDVGQKPYIDFLAAPGGNNILRDAPPDHYHHHGLMFAIRVNGVNFWEEHPDVYPGKQHFVAGNFVRTGIQCGPNGTLVDESLDLNWISPRGTLLLEEKRFIRAQMKSESEPTLLTWVSVFAPPENREQAGINPEMIPPPHSAELEETTFLHGSYYNGFGLRFDESMDFGGRFFYNEGSQEMPLENYEFHTNVLCDWAAYTAKLHGKPVTVALYDLGSAVISRDIVTQMRLSHPPEKTDILEHPFGFAWDAPWIKPLPMVVYALNDPVEQRTNAYLSATANLFREPLELAEDQAVVFRYGLAIWDGERTPQEVEKVFQA